MLKGEAKKIYQRNYMRRRRAVRPLAVLDQVDKTLDDSCRRLDAVNKNMGEVIKTMANLQVDPNEAEFVEEDTPATKPLDLIIPSEILTQADVDETVNRVMKAEAEEIERREADEFQGDVIVTGMIPATEQAEPSEEPKATPYCGACHGRGYVELDTIGLVTGPCPVCKGKIQP